jgi:FAD:protein FMN transferase
MIMKKIYSILIITALTCCFAFLTSCKQKKYFFNEGYVFGSEFHITYYAKDDLQKDIENALKKFDASMSMFDPNSTLSKINKSGTESFDLSNDPWLNNVIEKSIGFSKISGGAFDITVAPLVNAWGFGSKKVADVTPEYIDSLLQFVGYKLLKLDNNRLIKADPRVMIDCSAIAVGYSCDIIGEFLKSKGVNDYLVEIGGEMAISGKNPKGGDWRIGISTPNDDSTSTNMDWQEKLTITNKGVATSGNYRSFYEKDGKRYSHTIDPATGYPVQHSLLSATVVANDGLTADALATAFMVMGVEKALPLAESLPDVEALFICSADSAKTKVICTSGMSAWHSTKN